MSRATARLFLHSLRRFNHSRPQFQETLTFELSQPPCPTWKLGDGASWQAEYEKTPRKTWVMKDTSKQDAYRLLTSAIIPRPIAFVSSLASDGTPNVAPFSYFSMVSHNPPLISVSFLLSPKRPKDTRENILNTKEFTVNIISENFIEAANACSVEAPAHVDEWIVSGLTMEPSQEVKPPCVKESAVSMECNLHFHHDVTPLDSHEVTTTIVLGLIKQIHVRESVLSPDGLQVDPALLRPVARLGGTSYSRLTHGFGIPRISWKKTSDEIARLTEKQCS
ncbi:hypothetical protein E1B28_000570 [Marasmius oreades]|uniref:Flavin reductase like domain-containing protein n=1 Tax=Marasmius oreades TaxID=181124 RepID=A0A9P8AEI3_9AGAR|nr:uncharacterized protein E1B28_000570 [Marasmius oreades]KAG7098654.1 hypothetical protein E1B28_000570 [Marasmius oreades]